MTKERYSQIRTAPNFLYQYFMEETGNRLPNTTFEPALDSWLMMQVGVHPITGRDQIVHYLDRVVRS